MRRLVVAAIALVLSPYALASEAAWRLAQGAFVAAEFADARTTDLALERGAYEANPLLGRHPSDVRLYATTAITTGAVLYLTHKARQRGYRKTAFAVLIGYTLLEAAVAIRNDEVQR